ncbi:uncharacterized protein LOC62_05G006785 [Vanrija pseudolonga]|uniref:Uncharacterized protein n=1 Tax=Vanrija pseudolonga TaxID=143232 RepID=A0AAF0YGT7_9TREE|nr:hypothetical protein LOC62_05G006785 [Vanrija pseudolonga]
MIFRTDSRTSNRHSPTTTLSNNKNKTRRHGTLDTFPNLTIHSTIQADDEDEEEKEKETTPPATDSKTDSEEYSTLSSPLKYFAFLAIFVVAPVGAYLYFYRGGRQRVKAWLNSKDYEKLESKA